MEEMVEEGEGKGKGRVSPDDHEMVGLRTS